MVVIKQCNLVIKGNGMERNPGNLNRIVTYLCSALHHFTNKHKEADSMYPELLASTSECNQRRVLVWPSAYLLTSVLVILCKLMHGHRSGTPKFVLCSAKLQGPSFVRQHLQPHSSSLYLIRSPSIHFSWQVLFHCSIWSPSCCSSLSSCKEWEGK